jgi:hypothetical protein
VISIRVIEPGQPGAPCVTCGNRAAVLVSAENVWVGGWDGSGYDEITFGLCAEHFNHLRSEAQHIWDCL